jgi:hypothetical protein
MDSENGGSNNVGTNNNITENTERRDGIMTEAALPGPLVLSDSVIRGIFLLLGVGILLPWNAFVSSKPYFQARLCNHDGEDIVNFEQWFGLIWNMSSVLSLGLIILGQALADYCRRKRAAEDESPLNTVSINAEDGGGGGGSADSQGSSGSIGSTGRDHSFLLVMLPLGLYTAVFALQAAFVLVLNMSPQQFLIVTLCGLAVCGTCSAIATAGIVSTAGLFPSHLGIIPFFSGQALGGVVVALANFVAAMVEDPAKYIDQHCSANQTIISPVSTESIDTTIARTVVGQQSTALDGESLDHSCSSYQHLDWAVFSYFLAGCIVLLLCLVGYHLIHIYQMREFRDEYEVVHDGPIHNNSTVHVQNASPSIGVELNDRLQQRENVTEYEDKSQENMGQLSDQEQNDDNHATREIFDEEYTEEPDEVAVFSAIKGPATCIFLTFTVTLCLFPSWISELQSSHECKTHFRLNNDLYIPFTFLLFNVGDLIGRMLAEMIPVNQVVHLSRKLVAGAILRALFFPLFLTCLSTVGSKSFVIQSDLYSLMVQFLFAVSNGLLVSTSFMWSPHLVGHTTGMQERASEIMTFSVCFGLLSGSLLAFPFLQMAMRILQ